MEKIILFYKFVPIADPTTVMFWQRALCEKLGLKGRVLVSDKGINGTLGGDFKKLKYYTREMKAHPLFGGIAYKWSDGSAEDFPRLVVKVRAETVTLGWDPAVDEKGIVGGGKHLKPAALHKLLQEKPDAVFFDGRNNYESAIGKFKGAVTPDVSNFRDMPTELDKPEYDELKDKPVITYCTGGIRCESMSALMKQKGFKEVYQLDGGIVKYGQEVGNDGLWEGKCFVFDKRMHVAFSPDAKDIGVCSQCGDPTSEYANCTEPTCNVLLLTCPACQANSAFCGGTVCANIGKKQSKKEVIYG